MKSGTKPPNIGAIATTTTDYIKRKQMCVVPCRLLPVNEREKGTSSDKAAGMTQTQRLAKESATVTDQAGELYLQNNISDDRSLSLSGWPPARAPSARLS